jgi:hypothetical protein
MVEGSGKGRAVVSSPSREDSTLSIHFAFPRAPPQKKNQKHTHRVSAACPGPPARHTPSGPICGSFSASSLVRATSELTIPWMMTARKARARMGSAGAVSFYRVGVGVELISLVRDVWMDGWMDGWMDEWMNGWMDGWDGWMDGWMDGWLDGGPCFRVAHRKVTAGRPSLPTPTHTYTHTSGAVPTMEG